MRERTAHVVVLLVLGGCRPVPPERESGKADTGDVDSVGDSGIVESADSTETDTDTGEADSDTASVDTDTGGTLDSDSAEDTEETDTAPEPSFEAELESFASAKLIGEDAGDPGCGGCGSASFAGDVNGDGVSDILIGMPGNGRGDPAAGAAFVVLGPLTGARDLSLADAILVGGEYAGSAETAGAAVAAAGDVYAEGFDDLLVGAPHFVGEGTGYYEGQAYLVLGPVSGEQALADADAIVHGSPSTIKDGHTGESVAGAGDVDGDGFDDVLIAAPGYLAAYLLRGPISGTIELDTEFDAQMLATGGVAGAGDTNGDGLADVLVGYLGAFLFEGPVEGALTDADADAAFVDHMPDASGAAPRGAGDLNADGYDDIMVDAGGDDGVGASSGAAIVFEVPFAASADVTSATAKLAGAGAYDTAASDGGLSKAGDLDGDGRGDLVIAAPNTGSTYESHYDGQGSVYILFGPVSGTISLADSPIILTGSDDDRAGAPVAGGGDVDGDGIPDILVGGSGDDDGGEDAGATWLVLGATLF